MTFLFVMQNLRKSALKISVNLRENKRSSNPKNTIPQMAQMEPQIDADFFLTALAYKQRTFEYLNEFSVCYAESAKICA